MVQVFKDGKHYRFGTSEKPPKLPEEGREQPQVCALKVKAFKKVAKQGECFVAIVKAMATEKPSQAAVNAVEANRANAYERVLKKFSSVFESLPKGMPPDGRVQQRIELQPDARPKSRPPYRLSQLEEA